MTIKVKESDGSWVVVSGGTSSGGGGGSSTWGSITGTLSNQTDLQGELDNRLKTDGSSVLYNGLKMPIAGSTKTLSTSTDGVLKWGNHIACIEEDVTLSTDITFNAGFDLPATGVHFTKAFLKLSYNQFNVKFCIETENALTAGTSYSIISAGSLIIGGLYVPSTSVLAGTVYGGGGLVSCFVTYLGEVIITPMVNIPANGKIQFCGVMFSNV